MFCCACGAPTVDDARFCHKCGKPVPAEPAISEPNPQQPRQETLSPDSRLNQCHSCGRKDNLHGWDFGLAMPLASGRVWSSTVASVAVSAVTIPLLGVGGFQLPGKRTTFRVLRLRLLLCDSCARQGGKHYSLHPSWGEATRLGFTEFLDADGLKRLQPTK